MPDAIGRLVAGDPGYQPTAADPTKPSSGLINTAPMNPDGTTTTPVTSYAPAQSTASTATATGYDANAFTVGDNQTVAGQVRNVIAEDSPLMQQAVSRANQKMNERGLINSSQAIGAGQSALYDAALPIASADAATWDRAMTNTVSSQNTAKQFGAQATNTANLTNAQLETQNSQYNAGSANTAYGDAAKAANTAGLQYGTIKAQGEETRLTEAQKAGFQTELTTLQGKIQSGQILTQAEQNRLTEAQKALDAEELAEIQGKIQTGQIVTQGEQSRLTELQQRATQEKIEKLRGELATGQIESQGKQARMTETQKATAQQELQKLEAASAAALSKQKAEEAKVLQQQQIDAAAALQKDKAVVDKALQLTDLASKKEIAGLSDASREKIAKEAEENKYDISELEATYKTVIQASATAGDLYKTSMAAMASIAQSTLTVDNKNAQIKAQISVLKNALTVLADFTDMGDLKDLLPSVSDLVTGTGTGGVANVT